MSQEPIVIAGLGNPGREYQFTRHNFGFLLLDAMFTELGSQSGAMLSWSSKFDADVASGELEGSRILLVKPLKFMNVSGPPLQQVLQFYKVSTDRLVVAYDDIDLPLGAVRIKQGGGHGGHNGIRSIVRSLSTSDFTRLKLGIGRPHRSCSGLSDEQGAVGQRTESDQDVSSWVLGRFGGEEQAIVDSVLRHACQALVEIVKKGVRSAQNKFNVSGSD